MPRESLRGSELARGAMRVQGGAQLAGELVQGPMRVQRVAQLAGELVPWGELRVQREVLAPTPSVGRRALVVRELLGVQRLA